MNTEILINVTPREVRAAIVENGILGELMIERTSRLGLTGNLYKGRVCRVLPGMQAAFVEIGLERTAFLHASNIVKPVAAANGEPKDPPARIEKLLHDGEEVLVQILKEPLGSKGARLTMNITIPSRFLVLLPESEGVGVSSRIVEEEERQRLKASVEQISPAESGCGYIVRTAAEGASIDALRADMIFLHKLWGQIRQKAGSSSGGDRIHEDLPLAIRMIRDLASTRIERIRVDSEMTFTRMKEFADKFIPELAPVIEHYTGRQPILDLYGIEDEIQKALGHKVELKSGGHVVIDQTEAMNTIDVNTGAYVGYRNQEETIFRTNLEATVVIARQLRLRNIGGIIIIDFIDMDQEGHRNQVLEALESELAGDHARNQITRVSPLGLIEMTRKRTRESLEHLMCETCPTCTGRGYIKAAETVCYEIFREILRQSRQFKVDEMVALAHPDVIEMLLDEEAASLAELEEFTGRPIRLQAEALYLREQFDIVLM